MTDGTFVLSAMRSWVRQWLSLCSLSLLLVTGCQGLQLDRLPLRRAALQASTAFAAATAAAQPVFAADALPVTLLTADDNLVYDIKRLFVRDPVDGYYAIIALGLAVYFGRQFIGDVLQNAKAQDEANFKAKQDGRADLTAAFQREKQKRKL